MKHTLRVICTHLGLLCRKVRARKFCQFLKVEEEVGGDYGLQGPDSEASAWVRILRMRKPSKESLPCE